MKKIVLALICALFLMAGCEGLFGPAIDEEAYADLIGVWLVETRPDGWVASRWEFTGDSTWTAYWQEDTLFPDEVVGVTGTVIRVSKDQVRIRIATSMVEDQYPGDVVVMTYLLDANKILNAGWEGTPDQLSFIEQ